MTTITKQIHFAVKGHRKVAKPGPAPEPSRPAGRTPRVSKLMALAIRFDQLLCDGKIADQSELARLAHVTQPRMTQIMNLLHLAPDIQEEILHLPPVAEGRDPVTERDLRPIAAEINWGVQLSLWLSFRGQDATMPAAAAVSRNGRERHRQKGHRTSAAAMAGTPRAVASSVRPEPTGGDSAVRGV